MADYDLWASVSPSWSTVSAGDPVEVGARFNVTTDVDLKFLEYHTGGTGASWKPTRLTLWREDTATKVAEVAAPANPTVSGWNQVVPDLAYTMLGGHTYRVVAHYPASQGYHYTPTQPLTPPAPLAVSGNQGCYLTGATNAYPDSTSSGNVWGVGVVATDSAPTPPAPDAPATTAVVDYVDSTWLSAEPDVNLHQTDLPWITKAELHSVASDVTTVKAAATGANGFDAIKAVADAIASAVGGIPGTIASAVTTITGQITSATVAIAGAGFHTIEQLYAQGVAVIDDIAHLTLGATGGVAAFPTAFTMVDSTTFDTSLAWDVPADLYVITFTGLGGRIVNTIVAGVDISYRLAWWCPLAGAFAQERRFIDSPQYHCYDGGRRMPGLLLHSELGGTGTVEAWRLS